MLETIVGFVALGISIFAVVISIVFYFKSDNLYKEMLKFISEIRVFSERTYTDTLGMVKEAWPHIWGGRDKETIEKESDEKIKQIKEEVSKEMKQEVEKIKKLDLESVKKDQFKQEIGRLEDRLSILFDNTSRKIAEIEREKERKIKEKLKLKDIPDEDIKKEILSLLEKHGSTPAKMIINNVSNELRVPLYRVMDSLMNLVAERQVEYHGFLNNATLIRLK